jgi:hypothetical protein
MWNYGATTVRLAVHDFSGMADYQYCARNPVVVDGLFDYGVKLRRR